MKFSLLSNEEISLFRERLRFLSGALLLLFAVLILRAWFMQVIYYEEFHVLAMGNRIRVIPYEAPRGLILDRNGIPLANSTPTYNILLVREDSPDLDKTLSNLSLVTRRSKTELQRRLEETAKGAIRFRPVVLLESVDQDMADMVDTYQGDLPGVSVEIRPLRSYPEGPLASHVVGYVGEVNEKELKRQPANRLLSGKNAGKQGVELSRNAMLVGTDGGRQVEVDHLGRELQVIDKPVDPVPGSTLKLTIDQRLQRHASTLMKGKKGVILMMRPATGEILVMKSFPEFDPNLFQKGLDSKDWEAISSHPDKPLMNRATQGAYPPGSTFKMLVAAAALDSGKITPETTFVCPGYLKVGKDIRYCWNHRGHGEVNLKQALQNSCNVYFYNLGLLVGVDSIYEYGRMFGFLQPTGVELSGEKTGMLPNKAWKERVKKKPWYPGETLPVAIGQGYDTATPLQLLNYVNVLANDGLWVRPTLILSAEDPNGIELISREFPRQSRQLPLSKELFQSIREGMVAVVNAPGGTGGRARSWQYIVAGKTGTTQLVGRGLGGGIEFLPHSFFVAYAPAYHPQVSVMVLAEHGVTGGDTAAPLAKQMLDYFFTTVEPPVAGLVPGEEMTEEQEGVEGQPAVQPAAPLSRAEQMRVFRQKIQEVFSEEGATAPANP
ncbi:MAG: penicillin-binding protein 2 [Deltaproteobacteria bacterium]|nr:penicillin-binding protein 2 [Deltaproteobacteria bacterium]MDH4121999.1 penicillin-binding protein 2 [Deltaproteobacteria bacterium]